eukprot:jgi/Tetstr1/429152/TSEL_001885.t1
MGRALADLSQLRAALLADGPAACVAIDDLSALVATHGGPQLDRHAEQESVRVDGLAAARLLVRVAHGARRAPPAYTGHIRGETVEADRWAPWHV